MKTEGNAKHHISSIFGKVYILYTVNSEKGANFSYDPASQSAHYVVSTFI